jgi:hypothetical protein
LQTQGQASMLPLRVGMYPYPSYTGSLVTHSEVPGTHCFPHILQQESKNSIETRMSLSTQEDSGDTAMIFSYKFSLNIAKYLCDHFFFFLNCILGEPETNERLFNWIWFQITSAFPLIYNSPPNLVFVFPAIDIVQEARPIVL